MKGEFDSHVFDPIASALNPGGTFLDVGANVGYYSLLALNLIGLNGNIHAFEIDPRPLRCLRRTIAKRHLSNIFLHEQALGNANRDAILIREGDCGHTRVSSEGTGAKVPMLTLDFWRSQNPRGKIQAIKLDVEGGELGVLQGAKELLMREHPLLVCEAVENPADRRHFNTNEFFALLKSVGYTWHWLEGCNDPTIIAKSRMS